MIILCDKHGEQGTARLCFHLASKLSRGESLSLNDFGVVNVEYYSAFLNGEFITPHWFCHRCLHELGLNSEEILAEKEMDKTLKEVFSNLEIYCYECFQEQRA
jgi:hypothetical protein